MATVVASAAARRMATSVAPRCRGVRLFVMRGVGSWDHSCKPVQQRSKLQGWLLSRNKYAVESECVAPKVCSEWTPFFSDALIDPYVDLTVYKRSSYFAVKPSGEVEQLPPAPMTQSKEFNGTDQGDTVREYLQVQSELVDSPSFQEFVRHFGHVHGLGPDEPINAVHIQTRIEPFAAVDADGNGIITREEYEAKTQKTDFDKVDLDGSGTISAEEYFEATAEADPLSGQGIHRDGMQAVSVLCVSRENCEGADSEFYEDRAGTRLMTNVSLEPGDCVHFHDLDLFHNVTPVRPRDPLKPMHRSVVVLLARFQDPWWYDNVVAHYGRRGYNCIPGVGDLQRLFHLLDTDGNGHVDMAEFRSGLRCIAANSEEYLHEAELVNRDRFTRSDLIACLEKTPIIPSHFHR